MASTDINLFKGDLLPSVTDTIRVGSAAYNLTGSTVRFRMRPSQDSTLKVDSAATIVAAASGTVSYDWAAGDVNTPGEYRSWWEVTTGGKTFSTPERIVIIDEHSDGSGVRFGPIAYQAKQFLPVTWSALSKDSRYGDNMLLNRVNYVKYRLFSTISDATAEANFYNPLIQDFAAKVAALQIIPAGIDYWMDQHLSVQTSGTSEAVSYPDRIAALDDLRLWLTKEVAEIQPELADVITVRKRSGYPAVTPDGPLLTSNPSDFGAPWDEGLPKNLPWGPGW